MTEIGYFKLHTGWAKNVIPLVHYITLYERYHFFGPPCTISDVDLHQTCLTLGLAISVVQDILKVFSEDARYKNTR